MTTSKEVMEYINTISDEAVDGLVEELLRRQWVSIKDKTQRLPPNQTYLLVRMETIDGANEKRVAFHHCGIFYLNNISSDDLSKCVTHWMDLPGEPI